MNTEERLRRFIMEEVRMDGPSPELDNDYPLIGNDLIDSLGIFHLVGFVEQEFGVEVLDEELVPEHFGTIRDIARLVESKK